MKKALLLLGVSLAAACGSSAGNETTSGGGGKGGGSASTGGPASTSTSTATSTSGTSTGSGGGASCSGKSATTAGVQCTYAYSGVNSSPSVNTTSTVEWSCTATMRTMTSNGIPDHATGTFPNANCPNTISAWSAALAVPLAPTATGTASDVQVVGFALNGVKFDPSTAGTCTVSGSTATCSLIGNTGTWNIEALGQTSFNFGVDDDNAHVQPTGEYHYHGMPTAELAKFSGGETKPTLVGFAFDGFPVYARYGYTDAMDSTSAVKVMKGSYQLKSTPDASRPSTTTYPMGAFTQDYEYVAGSGDLDQCNGRTDVTPDFPCGIYHYYITDTYPFIQRCVMGTATGGSEGGGDGGSMMPADGGQVPMCMPGQTSMCCGDGICEGPENHQNCPEDCP
jgi:YHYH protein